MGVAKADSNVLTLAPQASDKPSETHAALAATTGSFGDLDMTMRMKTVKQLREGRPNRGRSRGASGTTRTAPTSITWSLKPNGWELGKADPAYEGAQRFLATGSKRFPIRKWHRIHVRQTGRTMKVWANGQFLTKFTDRERPYKRGKVAVYNEDAEDLLRRSPDNQALTAPTFRAK